MEKVFELIKEITELTDEYNATRPQPKIEYGRKALEELEVLLKKMVNSGKRNRVYMEMCSNLISICDENIPMIPGDPDYEWYDTMLEIYNDLFVDDTQEVLSRLEKERNEKMKENA